MIVIPLEMAPADEFVGESNDFDFFAQHEQYIEDHDHDHNNDEMLELHELNEFEEGVAREIENHLPDGIHKQPVNFSQFECHVPHTH